MNNPYYIEYDDECGFWCVFCTDEPEDFAYSTWCDKEAAQKDADARNTNHNFKL